MNAFMQWMETHFMPMAAKIGSQRHLIMGRDPVELAKRAKYKPPAMRVRGVGYTKKSPFRYKIR